MRSSRRLEIAILLLVISLPISGQTSAQKGAGSNVATSIKASPAQKPDGVAARLSAIVASGHLDDLRWPDFSDYRSHLTNFYRPSGYKLAWVHDGEPTPQALELIQILRGARTGGSAG